LPDPLRVCLNTRVCWQHHQLDALLVRSRLHRLRRRHQQRVRLDRLAPQPQSTSLRQR